MDHLPSEVSVHLFSFLASKYDACTTAGNEWKGIRWWCLYHIRLAVNSFDEKEKNKNTQTHYTYIWGGRKSMPQCNGHLKDH